MTSTGLGDRRQWVVSLLEQYEAPLFRFATRLLDDADAARDCVQHAFLRLCEQSPEELQGRAAQWLFTVCRNKAVDLLRSRQKTSQLGGSVESVPPGGEPDPAALAERQEVYRRLNALVDGLPRCQREAFGLWLEGFTYGQIAEIVDRNQGNVRVQVHRAIKHLREHPLARRLADRPAETEPQCAGQERLAPTEE